jgi:hypothetical protein
MLHGLVVGADGGIAVGSMRGVERKKETAVVGGREGEGDGGGGG